MMRNLLAVAALPLILGGCGSKNDAAPAPTSIAADDTSMSQPPAAALAPGQMFANKAASSDAFEIASSRLAIEKSQSAAVKRYAQKMVEAHTQSTAKLKTAAAGASPAVMPDPTLTATHQNKLTELGANTGAAFDRAYMAAQVEAHQMTLDDLQTYAGTADVPQLGTFAKEMIPIVTAHLNMAKAMKR